VSSYLVIMGHPIDVVSLDLGRGSAGSPWLFASPLVRVAEYRCTTPQGGTQERIVSSHTIVLPASGTCWVENEGQRAISDPNVFLYLNADSPFRASHPTGSADSGHTLVVRPDLLLETGIDEAPLDPRRPFVHLQAQSTPGVFLMKQALLAHIGRGRSSNTIEVEEVALRLAAEALSLQARAVKRSQRQPGTARVHREWVEHVKAFLGQRFADPIRLDDIAQAARVSAFHLCRVFKSSTGLSIHQYLNRLRLRVALERVADPSVNLMNLALDLGFSSHSHFSYAFRREYGTSPTAFRTATRKNLRELYRSLGETPTPRRGVAGTGASSARGKPFVAATGHGAFGTECR
jgi:AraC family transcriptional regulator